MLEFGLTNIKTGEEVILYGTCWVNASNGKYDDPDEWHIDYCEYID